MGKKAIISYLHFMSIVITFVALILTWVGLYGGHVNPMGNSFRALLCFGLPVMIIFNIILLIYWIIRLKIWAIVPVISILSCWNYIGTLYRFDSRPETSQQGGITVATYNVAAFQREVTGYIAHDIKNLLVQEGADIVCMQEFSNPISAENTTVIEEYKDEYPYSIQGAGDMIIFSKYPIKRGENLKFDRGGGSNSAHWADIEINGKEIRIYNVHMQTTGVNSTLHQIDKQVKNGGKVGRTEMASRVVGSWEEQFSVRAGQAIQVANQQRQCDKTNLLCGDFNDTPYSYCYNTLLGNMKDGFVTAGHGFMYTYTGARSLLRIDYIFHTDDIKGLDYYTCHASHSDHNPVFFKFVLP